VKKAFFILSAFAIAASSRAVEYGKIDFQNRNIPTSQPNSALPGYVPGGNGNGTYHVPIYQGDGSGKVGAGVLPGGVTVGLFEAGATVPLVTSQLRTDTPANAAFFATAYQTAITSQPVGSTPTLIIRAWESRFGSFNVAKQSGDGQWREWSFTSPPLGGTLPDGSVIATPAVTGWGPQDGSGFGMFYEPPFANARINSPTNGSIFAAPATINVFGEAIIPDGVSFVLTNLTLFVSSTLFSSQSGSSRLITASTPPLAAGSYALNIYADGYFVGGGQVGSGVTLRSIPVNITVVEPVEMSITPPQIVSGEFKFNYAANPGLKYVIKTSADLFDWQPTVTNIPTTNPAIFSQAFNTAPTRYFKVERLPNP
jgi:hypothetical protein